MESISVTFEVKIVFEGTQGYEGFISGRGFSVLIYNHFTDNYLLFDTGSEGEALIHNIGKCGIELSDIKKVIISHNHQEHSGGLEELYNRNPKIEIYVPIENFITYNRKYSKSKVMGVLKFTEIDTNIYSTGQLGNYLKEQALFLKTYEDKIIILVGCAHPGLDEIIMMAKSIAPIKAIIGGFHNSRNLISLQNIEFIGACHCTQNLDLIKQRYPEQFNDINVGKAIEF
ncbi:MAG: MBL fold metallo-hydrolase [Promethearchaeota archaeon]